MLLLDTKAILVQPTGISEVQRKALRTIWQTNGSYTPLMLAVWEDDYTSELPMMAIIESFNDFSYDGYSWDITIVFREVF